MKALDQAILAARRGPHHTTDDGRWVQTLRLPPDFFGFAGHFPDNPLLPAYVQIRIAQTLIETAVSRRLVMTGVFQAKFQRPIRPGETVMVTVTLPHATDAAFEGRVRFSSDGRQAAVFRIAFAG
jgi:3-hydroxyacyl-[acyl-carrier-protein] dehydratase